MKKSIGMILLLISYSILFSQNIEKTFLEKLQLTNSSILYSGIEIPYVCTGTKNKTKVVFISGSEIRSLLTIMDIESVKGYPPFPSNTYLEMTNEVDFFALSKPFLPLVDTYKPNQDLTERIDIEKFISFNKLSHYLNEYEVFIKMLQKKYPMDKIIVIGHSQGGKIAYELAKNKSLNISKTVVMSTDPYGRLDELIYDENNKLLFGMIDEKQWNQRLDSIATEYQKVQEDTFYYYKTWQSFESLNPFENVNDISGEMLFVYGSNDVKSTNMEKVYIHLKSKFNIDIDVLRLANRDHNYFINNEEGKRIFGWDDVFKKVIDWAKE